MHSWRRKAAGFLLAASLFAGSLSPPVRSYHALAPEQRVLTGQKIDLNLKLPPRLARQMLRVAVDGRDPRRDWSTAEPGVFHLQLRLFGVVPLKSVTVEVLKKVDVIPGGQSIGIMLQTRGVVIVGLAGVENSQGKKVYPAKEAGLQVGDVILAINGQQVSTERAAANAIDLAGKREQPAELLVARNGKEIKLAVKPEYCQISGRYRLGIYVRDNAAGVGTLTFYNQEDGKYAALGHAVMDWDGRQMMAATNGRVINAYIQGVNQSLRGQPGEKIGVFVEDTLLGNIESNTPYGICGQLYGSPLPGAYAAPLPVALASEVAVGTAEILTVISGHKVERFQVEIERVMPHQRTSGKGMILRITDSRLLQYTGGIVQGMSGSPIVQDGKMVGAVTHVFINDPTRGYGVFAEWMLTEMGLMPAPANTESGRYSTKSPGFCC